MIKKFESFVNEELHKRNNDNEYIGYVVVNYSDGSVLSHYSIDDDLNDAIEEVTELSRKDKYGTYLVCGVCKDNTYSYDIDDENNTIVYNTDESQISETNNKNYFDTLNESFTNQELKDAIKAHGGLSKVYKDVDARTSYIEQSNSFDLVNCKYCGYISPEIVKIIDKEFNCNIRVWYYIYTNILKTNDGGAIIIDNGDDNWGDEHSKWIKKMKIRNNNWKEDWLNNNTGKSTRLWRKGSPEDVDYIKMPDRTYTNMRRSKHINRK